MTKSSTYNVVFAGTPDFAAYHLTALIDNGYKPRLVLTQPDRAAGRGRKLTPSPVKTVAENHDIAVFQPQKLDSDAKTWLQQQPRPDLLIVVAYGLLLPQWMLDWATHGAINVHASLLPRWRGAAPIQRAIAAGDKETGVGIMQMDNGLDTGAVWSEVRVPITETMTAGQLHDKLQIVGAQALIDTLPIIWAGDSQPMAQLDEGITYAKKLTKAEAQIDWSDTPEAICRKIRAYNPVPVAHSVTTDGIRFRFYQAIPLSITHSARVGEVIREDKDAIVIAGNHGAIAVSELQEVGKKRLNARDYLNGKSLLGGRFL